MSAETYIFKDNDKPIFDDLVSLQWKVTTSICVKGKVKGAFSKVDNFK
jgi:hypothetical protein